MRFGNRQIEIFEWCSIITEELENGLISYTINNEFRFTFNKKQFNKIQNNFFDYL